MKKCPKCGTQNEANALFCAECGTHLEIISARPPLAVTPENDEEETLLSFRNKISAETKTVSISQQAATTLPHNPTLPLETPILPKPESSVPTPSDSWLTQRNLTIGAVIVVGLWLACVIIGVGGTALTYLWVGQ